MTWRVANRLHFFWIVLGLAVVAPVLVLWVRGSRRREWVAGGVVACSVPVLTAAPEAARADSGARVTLETAWTWWLPYRGVFILGWALRGVVLRGRAPGAAVAGVVALVLLVGWQWRNPATPRVLDIVAGVNYYSPAVIALTVLVFLVGQATPPPTGSFKRPPACMRAESPALAQAQLAARMSMTNTIVSVGPIGGDPFAP